MRVYNACLRGELCCGVSCYRDQACKQYDNRDMAWLEIPGQIIGEDDGIKSEMEPQPGRGSCLVTWGEMLCVMWAV